MAQRSQANADNVPGALFTDASCIDCGTCSMWAPTSFAAADGHRRVHAQPTSDDARLRAAQAQVACPVAAIGGADASLVKQASTLFPLPIMPQVHYCGWACSDSFGASSWFIERAQGNVLIDTPRHAPQLVRRFREMGGIAQHIMTHIDDVGPHDEWHADFNAPRVMHEADAPSGLEHVIDGDEPIALTDDLLLIPTPGHTGGSICILWRDEVLFTGDSLWWNAKFQSLSASRIYCANWQQQLKSLDRLRRFRFRAVLPGHGDPRICDNHAAMAVELDTALARLAALGSED